MSGKSAASGSVTYLDADGSEIYPCRCGKTHTGPQAIYEYLHHNCFHDMPLVEISRDDLPGQYMCPSCGKDFWLASDDAAA